MVERLAALPMMKDVPRAELEWLAAHGEVETYAADGVVAAYGAPVERLVVVLSGQVVTEVDRGAGPRRVAEWLPGTLTGKLPYSRLGTAGGRSFAVGDAELLAIHERHFPGMVRECPVLTTHAVHQMIDRTRRFRTSELQDEKMISLGKLAAGLAHEINNPASATLRAAKQLHATLAEADAAARRLGAEGLSDEVEDAIEATRAACLAHADAAVRSSLEQSDREDTISDWLARHDADQAHAVPLAETAVTLGALDALADAAPASTLDAALRWIAAGCTAQSLARDIEQAATRIHELVAAVKRFTYMDAAAAPGPVDVTAGIRDTVRVLAAKARARGAGITLDVEPGLPPAHAIGSELNQVWLNLLDNALDAVPVTGHVTIGAGVENHRVVVRVVDDGPGIPPDVLPRIFDAFFTTKPPGQGTGLGLEITRQLVRQANGDITVHSEPGHTEFRVSLPIA